MIRFLLKMLMIGLLLIMAAAAAGGWFYWQVTSPLRLSGERVEFQVTSGSGMRAVAREIAAAGIDFDPWILEALARLRQVEGTIKAGNYEISQGSTLLDLLDKLTRGDVMLTEIVFIEGQTFRQMRGRLDAHPDIKHDSKNLSDAEIMRRVTGRETGDLQGIIPPNPLSRWLGVDDAPPEGWFFPDTYQFAKRSSDIDVLARAHQTMRRHLEREWKQRTSSLPLSTPYQALILASIVEKETGLETDRPQVAAVFLNRLKQGMLLQSDPTVIYGLGERFDGNLKKRDLSADTPYNTYARAGLPPTPIAMPGLAALRAVLRPVSSPAFYFVARGDGSSQFSRTLEEHNHAVNRYQRRAR